MRLVFAMLACLVLAQCATRDEDRPFRVGEDPGAYVIIGVAEAASNTSPRYTMLWRRLGPDGQFMRYGGGRIFEVRTQSGGIQVPGIPGEFMMSEIEPGEYALDSVFAVIRDGGVNYIANGVVKGPERPAFTVQPGEAVYIGIWETNLEEVVAVTQRWRLDQSDLDAAVRRANPVVGQVRLMETYTRSVPCAPYRINNVSQRQVC